MAKRDRLAEIRRRWRAHARTIPILEEYDAGVDETIAAQETMDEAETHYHDDIGYLLRRLARAEKRK